MPFLRPAELSGDRVPMVPALQHAVRFAEEDEGVRYAWVCLLQPTVPFRTANDIREALVLGRRGLCDSVISVVQVFAVHPMLMKRIDGDRLLPYCVPEPEGTRRQDYDPPAFMRNGAIYLTRRDVLMERSSIWGDVIRPLVMPPERSVGVDSELDMKLVELMMAAAKLIMCGIAVIAGGAGSHQPRLQAMLDAQRHRGPDGEAIVLRDGVGLGHLRLAIIDLSAAAAEPMPSADGTAWLVFNGEIYNYRELREELAGYPFRTRGDAEVLLAAYQRWGEACLDRFIGMFAFALWDERTRTLFAARDRFGVKPLHYAVAPDGALLIASEIKALHAAGVPREPDAATWATYFAHGMYDHGETTFWSGIRRLAPGSVLRWSASRRLAAVAMVRRGGARERAGDGRAWRRRGRRRAARAAREHGAPPLPVGRAGRSLPVGRARFVAAARPHRAHAPRRGIGQGLHVLLRRSRLRRAPMGGAAARRVAASVAAVPAPRRRCPGADDGGAAPSGRAVGRLPDVGDGDRARDGARPRRDRAARRQRPG